jgi:starch synthase (maltosyl-transferring)
VTRPDSLSEFIARVNKIRRDHAALQFNDALHFHNVDNDQIIAYSKTRNTGGNGPAGRDLIVTVVSLDHQVVQSGWVGLDLDLLGLDSGRPYVMRDLLTGASYSWQGADNFVMLDPTGLAAHIFSVEQVPVSEAGSV